MSLLSVKAALEQILSSCLVVQQIERLPLQDACGRVLAGNIHSTMSVPAVDNSAMDGYALNADDYSDGIELTVSQRIPAGCVAHKLKKGSCARIFTGAPLPVGANVVVMQENARITADGAVVFSGSVKIGQNIRKAGEDIRQGDLLLSKGTVLKPGHLGLLASVGMEKVNVYRRVSVAVLSTGNELKTPGEKLQPGQIYNSNRFVLVGWLQSLGITVVDGGCIGDALAPTIKRMGELADQVDMLISTGGVSVGEEDHVKAAVEHAGKLDLWKIAVKPGKPLAFGRVNKTVFFGLPGNPVSAFATFRLFVLPYLKILQGQQGLSESAHKPDMIARAAFSWHKQGSREEYLRARLFVENGECWVETYPHQGSGVLSSVVWANVLVKIPSGHTVKKGEPVEVFRLYGD